MINNIKTLCTTKQIIFLILLLFTSLLMAILEFLSLGSIPIFASALIGGSLPERLSFINKIEIDFLDLDKSNYLFLGCGIVAALFLFKNIFFGFVVYFENKVIKTIRSHLGLNLFKFYLSNDYSFHLKTNPAILLRNVEGEVSQTTTVILRFLKLFREITILITIFSLLIIVNFKITIIIFGALFTFLSIFFILTKKILERSGKEMQFVRAQKIQHINQSFSAIKDIKVMNKEKYIIQLTKKNIDGFEKPFLLVQVINSLPKLFIETLIVLGVIIFAVTFIALGKSLLATLPILSLIIVAAIRLFPSFTAISGSLIAIKTYRPSYKLVTKEFEKLNSNKANLKKNLSPLKNLLFNKSLLFKNVNFSYDADKRLILKDINVEIIKGKKIGIIGKSGSGKSTFVNLLIGLLKPVSGNIYIDNIDVNENLKKWQSMISYIPQDIYLIDDTIKSNIAFGIDNRNIDEIKIDKAAEDSRSKDFIKKLPQGFDTLVGNRGTRLSGGQKQRIGVARALYDIKNIIVIDEGTNSLDFENEKNIINNIFLAGKNKTIIMISHNHETLKNCDELIIIDEGRILDKGNHKDLSTKYDFTKFIDDKK